jgi:signal peptidase I
MIKKISVWIAILIGLLLGIYNHFFIGYIKVPTGAMANTIIPGDHLITHNRISEINRGDMVIFRYPQDPQIRYLKRVIGLPGETIDIKGAKVFINGKELEEKRYLVEFNGFSESDPILKIVEGPIGEGSYGTYHDKRQFDSLRREHYSDIKFPYQIPEDSYFMMGDNRDNSFDSRFWGSVHKDLLIGKPLFIYWSVGKDNQKDIRFDRIGMKVK